MEVKTQGSQLWVVLAALPRIDYVASHGVTKLLQEFLHLQNLL